MQAPLQPLKIEPVLGVVVRVTTVPFGYAAEQLVPQLIPDGLDVTVPAPVPFFDTASVSAASNVAVTLVAAFTVTVHVVDWPVHAPLQPANVEDAVGVAVSVTTVPFTKRSEQSAPQLMPIGFDVTVPEPWPARVIVNTEPTMAGAAP